MTRNSHNARGMLPSATSNRWQPIRSGLLNLFRFDYEEFRFEQGRLLLRGNNGTGKSRVLALQLPFLLDGEVAPGRLEPDGDSAKKVEWNLLLDKHGDRLGYTWLEFGRQDEDNQTHYLTLGCGLRASEGRGLVSRWFFITRQRIGEKLYLQNAAGQPLPRERLIEAVGEHGEVFTNATAYRQAVDRTLFKLGDYRYNTLVNLLIQLRQPQLSRKLDEKRLSAALSEALPPVAPSIVADVAESFRSLEADREMLNAFAAARDAVDGFLGEYRTYCQIAVRRRAEEVRKRHSEYESTMRQLRSAESQVAVAGQALQRIAEEIGQLNLEETTARATIATLEESPAMRDAKALDAARQLAKERLDDAHRASDDWDRAAAAHTECRKHSETAAEASRVALIATQAAGNKASECASAIGLAEQHRDAVDLLGMPDQVDISAADAGEELLDEIAKRRREAARHLGALNRKVADTEAELNSAKQQYTQATVRLDDAREQDRGAQAALEQAVKSLLDSYGKWTARLTELRPADVEQIESVLAEWSQAGEGRGPIASAVDEAFSVAANRLAALRGDCQQRLDNITAEIRDLRDVYERLHAGRHEPPPCPHTRDESGRANRPGSPLWMVCDFLPTVPDETRSQVEAALEAAGLLDAWVTPDGRLLDATQQDTVLAVGTSPLPPENQHLGMILQPCIDHAQPQAAAIADSTVTIILRHIGFQSQAGCIWVDADGRWQLGPLHGRWSKPAAQHIGQAARDADRRRRLTILEAEIAEKETLQHEIESELAGLERRQQMAQQERAAAPDESEVHRALAEKGVREQIVAEQRAQLAETERQVETCRHRFTAATQRRDEDARDLGIAHWITRLQELEDGITYYQQALAGFWPTVRSLVVAGQNADAASQRAAVAAEEEQRRHRLMHEGQKKAQDAAARRDTLEEAVGASAKNVMDLLVKARERQGQIQQQQAQKLDEREATKVNLAVAERDVATNTKTLETDTQQRAVAVEALAKFTTTGLLSVAIPELAEEDPTGWSVTRAVDVARRIEAVLTDVDSDNTAWERNQRGIHQRIQELTQSLLPHGHQTSTTMEDGMLVVTVPFQGRNCGMPDLRMALSEEVTQRQTLLNAREREILENHLVGEVAIHLHERLRAAEELVREMNDELKARPTSTGMMLRFLWEAVLDGPPGLPEARKRLLAASGTWSPQDRQAVGSFLQQQIQAVRAANDTGTWQEHLAAALDYRTWHQFSIERHQDGQWKRLTRRTHGTGSGGEKAVALTIPQFAAAAAHYRTADPLAPRLILLDEAFVGIDTDMRSKCMDLLHHFDLDFVMTSEREWGCYPTLPGLAIYQLSSRAGFDAVGTTRWVWNGHQRVRDDPVLPTPGPPAQDSRIEGPTDARSEPKESRT